MLDIVRILPHERIVHLFIFEWIGFSNKWQPGLQRHMMIKDSRASVCKWSIAKEQPIQTDKRVKTTINVSEITFDKRGMRNDSYSP